MDVRNLADIEAIEQTPFSLGGVDNTYTLIARSAQRLPDAPALSFIYRVDDYARPRRWTYAEWLGDITRTANLLRRLGLGAQEVVAFALPNVPEAHLAMWGGETAGIAFALNPALDGWQLGELLAAARAQWLVTLGPQSDPALWARVRQALARAPGVRGILAVDLHAHQPGGSAAQLLPPDLDGVAVRDFHAEMAREDGTQLQFTPPPPQAIAAYLCTGGTTGLPKIAQHSHANEIANTVQLGAIVDSIGEGHTRLTALPLFHVNALISSGLSGFAKGAHSLLAPPEGYRSPGLLARFWEIIEFHRVGSFSGVPTVYAGLLQSPLAGRELGQLRYAFCGAAPMPVELLRRFEAETGMCIVEGYGLTEGTCVSALNPVAGERRVGCVGLRLPWQRLQPMVDSAAGGLREAAVEEVGVLYISGPNVFAGYLEPAHNAGNWLETPEPDGSTRRWFCTGDLGRVDAEGYVWLVGRKKELIIRGGHNIDPKTIEEALSTHPAVSLCAAVGRPDSHAGEVPVAYVQLRPGHTADAADLLEHAARHVGERAAVPKAVLVLDALPTTAVGKLYKPALVMREIEAVVRAHAAQAQVRLTQLQVLQEPRRGMVARYGTEGGDAQALQQALGRYTFVSERIVD